MPPPETIDEILRFPEHCIEMPSPPNSDAIPYYVNIMSEIRKWRGLGGVPSELREELVKAKRWIKYEAEEAYREGKDRF